MNRYCIIMTTVEKETDLQTIVAGLLKKKLAACIQTMKINSHYTWENKLCHEDEFLILIKTTERLYPEIENYLEKTHPYDTPEIICVPITHAFKKYTTWIDEVTKL